MADLVSLGDLPEWIGDGVAAIALYGGIRGARARRALTFCRDLENATGFTADQLRDFLENHDELSEIAARAWDAGSRAVDERKRRLLARALAAGFVGDETVALDDVPQFVRTLDQVDPVHVKLLGVICAPRTIQGLTVTGAVGWELMAEAWPGILQNYDPLVALLQREGLIRDVAIGGGGLGSGEPMWSVSNYGERFVCFVKNAEPSLLED